MTNSGIVKIIRVRSVNGMCGADTKRQNMEANPKIDRSKCPFNRFVLRRCLFCNSIGEKIKSATKLLKKTSCAIPNSRPTPFISAYIIAKPSAAKNAQRIAKAMR